MGREQFQGGRVAQYRKKRWRQLRHFHATEVRHLRRLRKLRRRKATAIKSELPAPNEIIVTAPVWFALTDEHHDQLADFLEKLRRSVLQPARAVKIDFSRTKKMIAGATLLFFSELQRLKALFPDVVIRCRPSRDDTVNQILKHLRIFDALGYQSSVVPSRIDVVKWRTASSSEIDGEQVGSLIETYRSLNGEVAGQLFRGASEAMMNSVNHAYAEDRGDGLPSPEEKKWWMFCRQDDDSFFVALCDLGIGIPKSLPLKYPSELIEFAMGALSRGRLQTDARLIQAAMELARTRTDRAGRGLGLHDLKRIVDDVRGSSGLYVFSNKGLVSYRNGGYARQNFNRSIRGTVVVWTIPLGISNG